MPRSFLEFDGMYDKQKRYLVNNWSDEDFTQEFGAESVYNDTKVIETNPAHSITIKAGEMRELGQFEAYTIVKHFVDREMYKDAAKKSDKEEIRKAEMALNNPTLRKPYEDKTLQEIIAGEETSFMDKMRAEIREEEKAKLNNEAIVIPVDETGKKIDKRSKEYRLSQSGAKAQPIGEFE